MWLITNFGFFSVVKKPGEKKLTVRARVRKDLEVLEERYLKNKMGEIFEGVGNDYPFRARVDRELLADVFKQIFIDNIDYPNFKNSVSAKQGYERTEVYDNVWKELKKLEQEN